MRLKKEYRLHLIIILGILFVGSICGTFWSIGTAQAEIYTSKVDFYGDTSEEEVLETMNKMTHQKVKANEKWGYVLMSPENIKAVYDVVEKSNFENREMLLEIAGDWMTNDFSMVVFDHNIIWMLQGGNTGKAYDVMTPKEEEEFIHHNFDK